MKAKAALLLGCMLLSGCGNTASRFPSVPKTIDISYKNESFTLSDPVKIKQLTALVNNLHDAPSHIGLGCTSDDGSRLTLVFHESDGIRVSLVENPACYTVSINGSNNLQLDSRTGTSVLMTATSLLPLQM